MSELEQLDPEVRDWEPHLALSPGEDGLSAYRSIAEDLPSYLASGGRGIFEIGHEQAEAVSEIFMVDQGLDLNLTPTRRKLTQLGING